MLGAAGRFQNSPLGIVEEEPWDQFFQDHRHQLLVAIVAIHWFHPLCRNYLLDSQMVARRHHRRRPPAVHMDSRR